MKEETRLVRTQVSRAITGIDPASLTPVAVEDVAMTIVTALDLVAALIPDLRTPHPVKSRKVRGARTVPKEAVVSIVAMVEQCRVMQQPQLVDTERAHEVITHDHNYRVVDERMERFRAQVRYTIEARWAELVEECMTAFHMAKVYAKKPGNEELHAHIATIRGHLDRTNGTTAKKKAAKKPKKNDGNEPE